MNRRMFIKGSAAFTTLAFGAPAILRAQGAGREFKVGIVGCGGRGNGAAGNIIEAAKQIAGASVKFVAAADFFLEKAQKFGQRFGVEEKNCFDGANGYKKVMESDAEIIILTTPLSFRPVHLAAAIAAGKHVFAEKGVAVDGAGVRLFIQTSREAAKKHLTIVAGTQRRHSRGYRLQAKALADGVIGPVIGGNVYWNSSVPWVHERKPGMTNKAYLCDNWLNFTELSGDHITEQHVHNIDIANWFIGRYPKSALCFGARARRYTGNQYDMFSTDFDYGGDVHIHSMCRQISGCHTFVGERLRTADALISGGGQIVKNGKKLKLAGDFPGGNGQVIEHVDLMKSILGTGPYYNEGEQVAMSTACAIIARLSAVTGQVVRMSEILENTQSQFYAMDCIPRAVDFEGDGDIPMPAFGDGQFPLPGRPWEKRK